MEDRTCSQFLIEPGDLVNVGHGHSALRACSRSLGAVPSLVMCCCSISAAHNAAPTVFVNAKKMEAIGTSSRSTAATPNLDNYQSTPPRSFVKSYPV